MEYVSEIISAVLGFLVGMSVTIATQKFVLKNNSSTKVNQKYINSNGDVAGRDINKTK